MNQRLPSDSAPQESSSNRSSPAPLSDHGIGLDQQALNPNHDTSGGFRDVVQGVDLHRRMIGDSIAHPPLLFAVLIEGL